MTQRSPDGHRIPPGVSPLDRQILGLAVPALGALVAEPLFVLVDSAVVGRLGTPQLAGLGLAGTVLTTAVGLCIFLAYATTATVARAAGSGDRHRALAAGGDGLWRALGHGVVLGAAVWISAPGVVALLDAPAAAAPHAVDYLRWSAPGLPGMLVVLAATGALRGMLDTRTPLWVAAGGAVLNAILSVTLVVGVGMGVAGSGLGTAIAQLAMAGVLVAVVLRGVRAEEVPIRPTHQGLLRGVRDGAPLLIRTLSLRAAILLDDGEFEGPKIKGKVVPISGGDFPLVRQDGVIDFDARYLLQTDDGATIYLQSRGFRWHDEETTARLNRLEEVDPALYYFRVAPKFDAPSGRHDWLNRHIFVGFGERLPDGNRIHYFKVL